MVIPSEDGKGKLLSVRQGNGGDRLLGARMGGRDRLCLRCEDKGNKGSRR